MSESPQGNLGNIRIDTSMLYREETYTDLQVGTIRKLTPVKPDGSRDETRELLFVGHTNVMTRVGMVPIDCPIEAQTLSEAIDKFPQAAQEGFQRLVEMAREQQREQASRIVIPETGPGGLGIT